MSNNKATILKTFNSTLIDFFDDMLLVFPGHKHIVKTKTAFQMFMSMNPSLIIKLWYEHVNVPYGEKIGEGNLEYFISKDYSDDIQLLKDSDKIINAIEQLREPIRNMDQSNKEHTLEYIQELNELSNAYKTMA